MIGIAPPRSKRQLTREHISPLAEYAAVRQEQRGRIAEIKCLRRIEVGPFATFHFENYNTMRQQIQEMLYIEMGGDAQLEDELSAYNPLIPRVSELIATIMFEIDEPTRRAAVPSRLGGIENRAFFDVAGGRTRGQPDPTRENTSAERKASTVQFLKFPFTRDQIIRFKTPGMQVVVGFDNSN
jgi:hypothetical protein